MIGTIASSGLETRAWTFPKCAERTNTVFSPSFCHVDLLIKAKQPSDIHETLFLVKIILYTPCSFVQAFHACLMSHTRRLILFKEQYKEIMTINRRGLLAGLAQTSCSISLHPDPSSLPTAPVFQLTFAPQFLPHIFAPQKHCCLAETLLNGGQRLLQSGHETAHLSNPSTSQAQFPSIWMSEGQKGTASALAESRHESFPRNGAPLGFYGSGSLNCQQRLVQQGRFPTLNVGFVI